MRSEFAMTLQMQLKSIKALKAVMKHAINGRFYIISTIISITYVGLQYAIFKMHDVPSVCFVITDLRSLTITRIIHLAKLLTQH